MLLSIVVPCFNEEDTLMHLYSVLRKEIDANKVFDEYELIFIDDGSRDSTLSIIKALRTKDKNVRFIS
ncbi:MAG: glycosyltransferase, partial [Peptostreptococcus anaerobius]